MLKQGAEASAFQLIAFDAIVEEEITVGETAVLNHGLDPVGGASEGNAQAGRLALRPADVFAGRGFVLAAGVAGVEQTPADSRALGHGNLKVGGFPVVVLRAGRPRETQ